MLTPNNYVCTRFLLNVGSYLDVIMTKDEADTLVEKFIKGELPPLIGSVPSPDTLSWAVKSESVQAIHTLAIQETQQEQARKQVGTHLGAGPRSGQPMSWRGK